MWRAIFWPDFSQFDMSEEARARLPALLLGLTMLSSLIFAAFSLITAVVILRVEYYVFASITAIPALLALNAVLSAVRAAWYFRNRR